MADADADERSLKEELEELENVMGLEMYGFVDGKRAFSEFLGFMPEKIKVG